MAEAEAAPEIIAAERAVIYLRVSTAEQAHGDGASEGYSIPAQREACQRRAHELGASVVAEFVDRGESARSAARPQLQQMLARLSQHKDIEYVIVHKVDRLARNRADDVQIQLVIERAGSRLVSVTENVDDTPSGKLVRNIMADLAEFYSANLATEILKGSTQKARMGGTPFKAPVGYMNIRYIEGGREVRTVEIDSERAPFVRRAFELYATGEYSLRQLHAQLTAEGFTVRPTANRPAQSLALSKLATLLRNRYYLGLVTYRGIEHPGKHPAIIGMELFERVGRILDEREQHSLKPRRNQHYLRGLLSCGRCGSRLLYTSVRGRHGDQFDYYVCSQRHRKRACDLPYLAAMDVEERVAEGWPQWVKLDELDGEAVARDLEATLLGETDNSAQLARVQRRVARLDKERLKLVQMAYADAIPLDLLKSEQERVTREREQALREAQEAQDGGRDTLNTYEQARSLMQRGAAAYRLGGPGVRRLLNQAFLERIDVDADDERATLASPWREIQASADHVRKLSNQAPGQVGHRARQARRRAKTMNPGHPSMGQGSNKDLLVGNTGLEPVTSRM
jgi:site-specific DNA recombinase